MNRASQLLNATSDRAVSAVVSGPQNLVRMRFFSDASIRDFDSWLKLLGTYYVYHFSNCVAPGADMPLFEGCERAKTTIHEDYRQQGLTLSNACDDAINGTNGGARRHLDLICDALISESAAHYIDHVTDTLVPPNDWNAQVELVRELVEMFRDVLPSGTDARPERLAHNYKQLLRTVRDAQRRLELQTRRL